MAQMKSSLGGIPVRRAMLTDFRTLSPADTLDHVIDLILAGFQHDFPVVEHDRVVGILMRNELMVALAQRGRETPVREVMTREFATADPGEMLETAVACLREGRCRTLPVVRAGVLVGMLTMDNVGEFMMIESALRGHPRRPESFGVQRA